MPVKWKGTKVRLFGSGTELHGVETKKQGGTVSSGSCGRITNCLSVPFSFSHQNGVTEQRRWNTSEDCMPDRTDKSFQFGEEDHLREQEKLKRLFHLNLFNGLWNSK